MLRQIVKPTTQHYDLQIPKEYINKEVEILVLPFLHSEDEGKNISDEIFEKTFGILKSKNIDPIKWQEDIRIDREV